MSIAQQYGFTTPHQARSLRACMVCSIIQVSSKFVSEGCPNCEGVLGMKDSQEAVQECTSANWNGMIAVADPSKSWVARWQRVETYVPGMYAVQVIGKLPQDVLERMEDNGMRYVPRDGVEDVGVEEE
ncbi:transcription elongation factor spt4 [Microthyrium microscopicum]|uniref:Transcription elongation factor SPT4 n=1 Tax=Microthyrium microscopicum TaxID=703497 RepID=A0A6A6UMY9_9PEZI|nr:transcription elongation factor spt4 [Microthyrium microscopicum]